MKDRDAYIQEVFNRLQQEDASLGTIDLLKPITDKFKTNAGDLLNSIFGEKYIKGFADRLGVSIEQFNALFENTEAPLIYNLNNIKIGAEGAGDAIEKSFGQTMTDRLETFKDSLKSVKESMADVVVKGIKGMEDALVNFVTTGKLNFRNLANSIIADMARIAIQQTITKPFTNFLTGLFGNANGNAFVDGQVQKYAYGGIVNKPTLFPMANGIGLMGEAGAEAILPLRRGSNGKLGVESSGAGIGNIVVNVDASGSSVEGSQQGGRELGRVISVAIQSELIKQKRPGGLLA